MIILSYFVEKVVFRKSISCRCKVYACEGESRKGNSYEDKSYGIKLLIIESVFK